MPFDILAGSSELREQIEAGIPARAIYDGWQSGLDGFTRDRRAYLLY